MSDMRTKFYDPTNHRLLYLDGEANEGFWDDKWREAAEVTFANPPRHGATIRTTRRYLPPGSRVLEGGCGLGDVVHALHKAGYAAEGVDFAPKVVQAINARWPHLNVIEGDVRRLPRPDDYYDGYWSFGVIEHFVDGYDAIAREMQRVLRPGGYLFLSFPAFNPFRQARAAAGKYQRAPGDISDFYQYALDPAGVSANFESFGFDLIEHRGVSSLLGLAEDSRTAAFVQNALDKLPSRVAVAVSMLMDQVVGQYAGHSCLLILRKRDRSPARPARAAQGVA